MNARSILPLVLLVIALPAAGCTSGGGASPREPVQNGPRGAAAHPRVGDDRRVAASALTDLDQRNIAEAWRHFLERSPLWRLSFSAVVERGGAGPYILSENLFRYFFQASIQNRPLDIQRVAESVALIGEPAAAYFAKPLVSDLVPLGKEVIAQVPDPDNPEARIKKRFRHFQIDDFTRRHAARVLVAIGPGAVPTLSSPAVLEQARPSGRRYAAFALGLIGTDEAVAVLARYLRTRGDWQDRAAAAQALGAALANNPAARPPLEAALQDPDPFVRRKADEALAGRTRLPI